MQKKRRIIIIIITTIDFTLPPNLSVKNEEEASEDNKKNFSYTRKDIKIRETVSPFRCAKARRAQLLRVPLRHAINNKLNVP